MQALIECTSPGCKLNAVMPLDRATKRAESHADDKRHVVRLRTSKDEVTFVDGQARFAEREAQCRGEYLKQAEFVAEEVGYTTIKIDARSLRMLFKETNREPRCSGCKGTIAVEKGAFGFRRTGEGAIAVACSERCLVSIAWAVRSQIVRGPV